MKSRGHAAQYQLVALVIVMFLTATVLVLLDHHGDPGVPVPTTVPVTRVPVTTTLPDLLRGGPWQLRFADSGLDAYSPEVPGASLASGLQFDVDGTVSGGTGFGGGCDDFTADYTIDGDRLAIGPLTGHFKCTAAAAIAIRTRLEAVTTYSVALGFHLIDNTLVLSGGDGTPLLAYIGHRAS